MVILINNKFVGEKDAKVSVLSEAFMYGYGVFETLRTYVRKGRKMGTKNIVGGRYVFEAEAHVNRLFQSAAKIDLKIRWRPKDVLKMLEKVAKKSPEKIQRIKITAIKEGVIITSEKLTENFNVYKGVGVKTVVMQRDIPEVKSISYLGSYLSHKRAASRGYYEAVLVDKKGDVSEGAYSNIFWFEGNTLCTRKDGVLPGITAQVVIRLATSGLYMEGAVVAGSLRSTNKVKMIDCPLFKVKFKKINIKNLLKKSEIFLTQTTKGIVPVVEIDGRRIGDGKVGKRTKILMKKFSDFTEL
jgi:branched-subunit amino acid aminotransferase/4-amino-4-deoxychorismate lyase